MANGLLLIGCLVTFIVSTFAAAMPEGCHFLEKHQNEMDKHKMDELCDKYLKWHSKMQDQSIQLTDNQRDIIDSFGSSSQSNAGRSGRKKRQTQAPRPRTVRREYRTLSDQERDRFHRALNGMKTTMVDDLSLYDVFVAIHAPSQSPGAHFGAAFYPFHREFLLRFEDALLSIDPGVSLPYWDSNIDHQLGIELAQHTMLWTDSFLGNGHGDVTEGPFANWRLAFPSEPNTSSFLHRDLTQAPVDTVASLMSDQSVADYYTANTLRNTTWFENPLFESDHGGIHNWVSGVMAFLPTSPSDPVFYLHHAFLDCLWEEMRNEQRRNGVDPQLDYPTDDEAMGVGEEQINGTILLRAEDSYHHPLTQMRPFENLRNIDGLNDRYFREFYSCGPGPRCSPDQPFCGSPYLFCNLRTYRCTPTLQLDADCSNFAESNPCMNGECCGGRCAQTCGQNSDNPNTNPNPVPDSYRPDNRNPSQRSDSFGQTNRDTNSSRQPDIPEPNNRNPNQRSDRFGPTNSNPNQGSDRFGSNNNNPNQGSDRFGTNNRIPNQGSDRFGSNNNNPNQGSDRFGTNNRIPNQGSNRFRLTDRNDNQGSHRLRSTNRNENRFTPSNGSPAQVPGRQYPSNPDQSHGGVASDHSQPQYFRPRTVGQERHASNRNPVSPTPNRNSQSYRETVYPRYDNRASQDGFRTQSGARSVY